MNQRRRMLDDEAGHYRALKSKLRAAGCRRDSSSGSHYRTVAKLIRIAHTNSSDALSLIFLDSKARLSSQVKSPE